MFTSLKRGRILALLAWGTAALFGSDGWITNLSHRNLILECEVAPKHMNVIFMVSDGKENKAESRQPKEGDRFRLDSPGTLQIEIRKEDFEGPDTIRFKVMDEAGKDLFKGQNISFMNWNLPPTHQMYTAPYFNKIFSKDDWAVLPEFPNGEDFRMQLLPGKASQ